MQKICFYYQMFSKELQMIYWLHEKYARSFLSQRVVSSRLTRNLTSNSAGNLLVAWWYFCVSNFYSFSSKINYLRKCEKYSLISI